jgi:predicted lipoprotein with Yx(FWY)xxD motif
MKTTIIALGAGALIASGLFFAKEAHVGGGASASQPERTVMPVGITFQFVGAEQGLSALGLSAGLPVLADERGRSLYTSDRDSPGKSACDLACSKEWHALEAPKDARGAGLWQPILRDDGGKQWAFRGMPLYTYVHDEKAGDAKGRSAEGWHIVENQAFAGVPLPDGISTAELVNAGGQVFLDAHNHALYSYSGDLNDDKSHCVATTGASAASECPNHWQPLGAGEAANNLGEFTVIERPDGTRQWAYQGLPLYTYDLDFVKEDANGVGVDARWSVALAEHYFQPAGIKIHKDARGFDMLVDDRGMTIYTRDRFSYQCSGFSSRGGQKGNPAFGQALAAISCTGDCLKSYKPVIAPDTAKPSGYWNIVRRPDGTRQWSYQGYVLFTYIGDKKPGDSTSHDQWDLSSARDLPETGSPIDSVSALFWREVSP